MRIALLASVTLLLACGGTVETPSPSDAATEADAPTDTFKEGGVSPEASPDADGCWKCADRAWRNTCVVPATIAPDAESCLHCGEHCDSGT
jgi:hypothetical protein